MNISLDSTVVSNAVKSYMYNQSKEIWVERNGTEYKWCIGAEVDPDKIDFKCDSYEELIVYVLGRILGMK